MRSDIADALRDLLIADPTLKGAGINDKVFQLNVDIDPVSVGATPPYLVFTLKLGTSSDSMPVEAIHLVIWGVVASGIDKPSDVLDAIMYRIITLLDRRPRNITGQHCYDLVKQDTMEPTYMIDISCYVSSAIFSGSIKASHLSDLK